MANDKTLIDHTIIAMVKGGCDAVLVITNSEKLPILQQYLYGQHSIIAIYYALQRGTLDIWSAIEEAFPLDADRYLFAMPDTIYPMDTFSRSWTRPFGMGLFRTTDPERFGVLRSGRVVNKEPLDGDLFDAWGTLTWTRDVVKLWQIYPPADYTDAINQAIGEFGCETWSMDYYYDMANYDEYAAWIRANHD